MSTTQHWLDLYSMILDRLAEGLADPAAMMKKFNITDPGVAANPIRKMDIEKYRESAEAWKRVKASIAAFGLSLDDDLTLAPLPHEMNTKLWREAPWVEVYHPNETKPLRFTGRDAMTAIGFFAFFINAVQNRDPRQEIRRSLEKQGITKDNFHEHVGLLGIANPWDDDSSESKSRIITP